MELENIILSEIFDFSKCIIILAKLGQTICQKSMNEAVLLYSGGSDRETSSLRPAQAKVVRP
jgi:hypothetical protein